MAEKMKHTYKKMLHMKKHYRSIKLNLRLLLHKTRCTTITMKKHKNINRYEF